MCTSLRINDAALRRAMHLAAITLSINNLITTVSSRYDSRKTRNIAGRSRYGACNPPMNPNESTTSATSTRHRGGFDARDYREHRKRTRNRHRQREREREEGRRGGGQTPETHLHTESRALSPQRGSQAWREALRFPAIKSALIAAHQFRGMIRTARYETHQRRQALRQISLSVISSMPVQLFIPWPTHSRA
jgi:hypothetical protein